VLDVRFPAVDPDLGSRLHAIPGVIEHGLFFSMAHGAIVAGPAGLRVLGELS
jgi:ribose 5-phosphate isomerase A